MAAEAQAESPAPVPPPLPAGGGSSAASSEKRARTIPGDEGAEEEEEDERRRRRRLPEPKRRRACVAALDSVPTAAAEGEEGTGGAGSGCDADGATTFSFQHARGGFRFVALETTPKFGSFNPPAEDAELAALDLRAAEHGADGEGRPLEADDAAPPASVRGAEEEDEDEDAQAVGGEVASARDER